MNYMNMQLESHITVGHSGRIFISITFPEIGTFNLVFNDLTHFLAGVNSGHTAARNIVAELSKKLRPSDNRPIVLVHDGTLDGDAFSPPYCPLVYSDGMTLEEVRESYQLVRATLGSSSFRHQRAEEDAAYVKGAWVVPAEAIGEILAAKEPHERKAAADRLAVEHIGVRPVGVSNQET